MGGPGVVGLDRNQYPRPVRLIQFQKESIALLAIAGEVTRLHLAPTPGFLFRRDVALRDLVAELHQRWHHAADRQWEIGPVPEVTVPVDHDRLLSEIDRRIPADAASCAVRIDGRFELIRGRSVPRQKPPYRPLTEVVAVEGRQVVLVTGGTAARTLTVPRLVLAPGAHDRPVAFPGWTLPGVITAGGLQTLAKTQRFLPDGRMLFAGSSLTWGSWIGAACAPAARVSAAAVPRAAAVAARVRRDM